jgi:hypothetical protein
MKLIPILCTLAGVSVAAQDLLLATQSNKLLTVRAGLAGTVLSTVDLTGLGAGEKLLGIDFRPADGRLYGLGDSSRLYRIEPQTGVCVAVAGALSPLLNGTSFGFDFNPTVDRIRVVSDADQNLRLHPDTGLVAAADGTLSYAAADPFAAVNPNIVGAAYTNNFGGATSTQLFGIDSNLDTLVLQNPPNAGVLNTVGSLGVNVTAVAGFDIAGSNGAAFAVCATPGSPAAALFSIDLMTGAATFLAVIGSTEAIVGMSVIPSPGVVPYGVATSGCFGPSVMSAIGAPALGNAGFALVCENAHPTTVGRLAIGAGQLTTPMPVLGFSLFVDPFHPATIWLETRTDANGACTVPLPIPAAASLGGTRLFSQFVWLDRCTRGGFAAANALALTLR